jgi:hypothetical protein
MNWRGVAIGAVGVFVLWQALGVLIHGVLLKETYAGLPSLFRPVEEMSMPLMYLTGAVSALAFTLLYGLNAPRMALQDSLWFGLLFGVGTGFGMGFGTYSAMPITMGMAFAWFLGTVAEGVLAALVLHWAFRPRTAG